MKFQGRTAVITGSGTGIGLAIAKKFAKSGASLVILGRRKEPLEEAAKILVNIMQENGAKDSTVKTFAGVDVADEEAMTAMFDKLAAEDVTIDYMINNAGVSGPVTCFANASMDDFRKTVDIHLTGTFWGSVQALKVLRRPGGKIITISTFFTEERPLEQRPYRFRSPYTASQGAKNRLGELISWEIAGTGIASIVTNPGPVHSDRIYKTVYPKAAAEFMRVSGFEDMSPSEVEAASAKLLPLLGEDSDYVTRGITSAAAFVAEQKGISKEAASTTLSGLLGKIQTIAEKVQKNTSRMIANQEFLSQEQVAESVLNLCDDSISSILDGKVVPGDRVFYHVKPHVGGAVLGAAQSPDLAGGTIIVTADPTPGNDADLQKIEAVLRHIQQNCSGKAVCFVSSAAAKEDVEHISNIVHSHVVNLDDPNDVERWMKTAQEKIGKISGVVHFTGSMPNIPKITEIVRQEWDKLIEKFVIRPATVTQRALEIFVPGGGADPRLFKGAEGAIMIVGPEIPPGRKTTGVQKAQAEVFRGALRPFVTTVNQELSDVLVSDIRVFLALPGSVTGVEPDPRRILDLLDLLMSGRTDNSAKKRPAAELSTVIFCTDETR